MMMAIQSIYILLQTTISIIVIHTISTGQTDGTGAHTTIGTTDLTTIITMIIGAIMITIGTDLIMDIMVLHTWRGNLRDIGLIFQQMASS